MSDYFTEMGWKPLGEGETPDHTLHMARLLRDFNMFDELLGSKLAPRASPSAVENLKTVSINAETAGKQCPVCLKEHELEQQVKEMPCSHLYHSECLLPWLEKTNSCPLCRFELPTDDEDYEAHRKEKKRAEARKAEIEILHDSMFS